MAKGRGSALLSFVLVLLSVLAVQGVDHQVGGTNGWKDPGLANTLNSTYLQNWAATQTFTAGDNLIFTYNAAAHDVLVVSKADYNGCITTNSTSKHTTGNDTITVPAGESYYICGTLGHCSSGQKLAVNATENGTSSSTNAAARNGVTVVQVFVASTVAVIASLALW